MAHYGKKRNGTGYPVLAYARSHGANVRFEPSRKRTKTHSPVVRMTNFLAIVSVIVFGFSVFAGACIRQVISTGM